jgi:hypothetical protein
MRLLHFEIWYQTVRSAEKQQYFDAAKRFSKRFQVRDMIQTWVIASRRYKDRNFPLFKRSPRNYPMVDSRCVNDDFA